MIIFQNPGEIDMEGVRLMGVSAKLPNSFGRFGTGVKYGIACVLRGGGTVAIYDGDEWHDFGTRELIVRGKDFLAVQMDGVDMGMKTNLGRDWEPWMVLREFACNARDEGGTFWLVKPDDVEPRASYQVEGETTVIVDWPALDEAYGARGELFLEGEAIYEDDEVRVLHRPSAHLFYQGVRVHKLDKPSTLTYDLKGYQSLTEDRTLISAYSALRTATTALLKMDNQTAIAAAITAGNGYAEHKFDFHEMTTYGEAPSRAFLDAAHAARAASKGNLNDSARKVLLRQMRAEERSSYGGGGKYVEITDNKLSWAVEMLCLIGVIDQTAGAKDTPIIPVKELPGEAMSMTEGGAIYLHESMLKRHHADLLDELFDRFLELRCPYHGYDAVVKVLKPRLMMSERRIAESIHDRDREVKIAAAMEAKAADEAAIAAAPPAPADPADVPL